MKKAVRSREPEPPAVVFGLTDYVGLDAGKHFALEELEAGSPASRNMRHLVLIMELSDCRCGISASHYCESSSLGRVSQSLGNGFGALCKGLHQKR